MLASLTLQSCDLQQSFGLKEQNFCPHTYIGVREGVQSIGVNVYIVLNFRTHQPGQTGRTLVGILRTSNHSSKEEIVEEILFHMISNLNKMETLDLILGFSTMISYALLMDKDEVAVEHTLTFSEVIHKCDDLENLDVGTQSDVLALVKCVLIGLKNKENWTDLKEISSSIVFLC